MTNTGTALNPDLHPSLRMNSHLIVLTPPPIEYSGPASWVQAPESIQQPFNLSVTPSLRFNPSSIALEPPPQYNENITAVGGQAFPGWTLNAQGTPIFANLVALTISQIKNNGVAIGQSFQIIQAGVLSPTIYTITNIQGPFVGFQNVVFTPSAPSVVSAPAQIVQALATGQIANAAPVGFSGTIAVNPIEQSVVPQLHPSLAFNPNINFIRQQFPTVPPPTSVISTATPNVNVAGDPAPSLNIITVQEGLSRAFASTLPNSLQFNPAYIGLRQQSFANIPFNGAFGTTANVSVVAPSGFVTLNIDGTGQVAQVSVAAIAGTITEQIDGTGQVANISVLGPAPQNQFVLNPVIVPQPSAFILPMPLRMNSSFMGLRVTNSYVPQIPPITISVNGVTAQANVAAISGGINLGPSIAAANVSVQAFGGTVIDNEIEGSPSNISVAANPGGAGSTGVSGPVSAISVSSTGLVTISKSNDSATVNVQAFAQFAGPFISTSINIPVSPVAGSITRIVPGSFSAVSVAATGGAPLISVSATGAVSVSAIAGSVNLSVSAVGQVNVSAISGTTIWTKSQSPAAILITAIPGSATPPTIISGVVSHVSVSASSGNISLSVSAQALVSVVAQAGIAGGTTIVSSLLPPQWAVSIAPVTTGQAWSPNWSGEIEIPNPLPF